MVSIHQLSNGLRVVVKSMEWTHSCAIGVWLRVGSILESEEENGLSHLLEHMSFKGTKNRSNRQLAIDMDAIGGQVNAATSKLTTEYYAQVLPEEAESALELLSDIVCNTVIEPAELEKEKRVIIEEIGMVEDSPEDSAHDMANALFIWAYRCRNPSLVQGRGLKAFPQKQWKALEPNIMWLTTLFYLSPAILMRIVCLNGVKSILGAGKKATDRNTPPIRPITKGS